MSATIPTVDDVRAIVAEVLDAKLEPLRRELAALRAAREDSEQGLSVAAAAALAGVSEKTIKRAIHDEELASSKLRGRRVIERASLVTWSGERTRVVAHAARDGSKLRTARG